MKIDFSAAWKSGHHIIDTVVASLPNLALAAVILCLFIVAAAAIRTVVRRLSTRRLLHENVALLLGQLAYICIAILGFLIALSAVAPSFHASDLIKMLGIGSVAIGFAFQNILQNFLAGILILLHEPFRIGDWISVTAIEGTVEDIQMRATIIDTADGHRVFIPNAVLFTNAVSVGKPQPQQTPAPPQPPPNPTAASATAR